MLNDEITLYRRLNAAEVILQFELGPGAAVGVNPDTIAAGSYKFLRTLVDLPDTPEALRFRALKLIAGIENARASAKASDLSHTAKHSLLLALANAQKSRQLRASGQWENIIRAGQDWALKDSDQLNWPSGWPGTWKWPPDSFANELQSANCSQLVKELATDGC